MECQVFNFIGIDNLDLAVYFLTMNKLITASTLIVILLSGCSRQQKKENVAIPDYFISGLADIGEIAVMRQLTDRMSDFFPYFSHDSNRICFTRVFQSKSDNSTADPADNEIKPFLFDIRTGDLYMADSWPEQVEIMPLPKDELPRVGDELPISGYSTAYGLFFSAGQRAAEKSSAIYLSRNGVLRQLIPGYKAAYLESISPSGRYVAITYNPESPKLIVYDSAGDRFYGFQRFDSSSAFYQVMPVISGDGRYLAVVVSDGGSRLNNDLLGNIWLLEFKQPDSGGKQAADKN